MEVFSMTDIGVKRIINQDYIFSSENPIGSFPNLFIVADGMGGHKAGDYASKACVDIVVDSIKNSQRKTPISILEEAINKANSEICKEASKNKDLEGMGTTFVCAVIIDHIMYVANIGDSRLYVINDRGIRQVTEDHSLVAEMIRTGELERKQARVHPNKNIITRVLGPNQVVVADYFEVEVSGGDIILLCSDGLNNMMDDDDIMFILRRYEKIGIAGKKLVQKANECGGRDNISVILITV